MHVQGSFGESDFFFFIKCSFTPSLHKDCHLASGSSQSAHFCGLWGHDSERSRCGDLPYVGHCLCRTNHGTCRCKRNRWQWGVRLGWELWSLKWLHRFTMLLVLMWWVVVGHRLRNTRQPALHRPGFGAELSPPPLPWEARVGTAVAWLKVA